MRPPPLVSVGMVTYNQERFVRESIRSVLAQTVADLELIVLDNGSTDDTRAAVAGFADPRVVYVREETNRGPGWGLTASLAAARGRFVALMTGDDLSRPDRLELQLAAHARAGGVVFANADYVDEESRPLDDGHYPRDFFRVPPMTPAEVLARFFDTGNFVHTVTLFAAREALAGIPLFDPLLYQLQDLELLIRLAKRHPFTFLPEPLVSWRILRDGGNLSAPHPFRRVRSTNEFYLILRRFFDDFPPALFREAFGHRFVRPTSHSPADLACEQAFLLLRHPSQPLVRLAGAERLHALLSDPAAARVLADGFGYTQAEFADQFGRLDPLGLNPPVESFLVGEGVAAPEPVAVATAPAADGAFTLAFDTSGFPPTASLRWDVVRRRGGTVRLTAVTWTDHGGQTHALDPAALELMTGERVGPGEFRFRTLFPLVRVPLAGGHRAVTVTGTWALDDPARTAWEVDERMRHLAAAADAHDARVRELTAHAEGLTAAVLARDDRSRELEAAVLARDAQLRAVEEAVLVRDEQLRGQAVALAERERDRAGLDDQVRQLAEQVQTLTAAAEATRRWGPTSRLHIDTGAGYRPDAVRSQPLPDAPGPFRQTFAVSAVGVRSLRWDSGRRGGPPPRVEAVEWTDLDGRTHRLPPGAVRAVGPAVVLPITGGVAEVTVAGLC